MAVELATGYISLVPSAKGFSRNLARELDGPLTSAGTDVGDRTARNFGRTFVAGVGTAATKGALALGAGFTLAAGFGIKIAADFEQTQIAFEGILGSADDATRVLGDLREFAARTPFEFTGLTESAQQLLGLGFGAEEIIPLMGTLGDVAAALGAGEPEIKGVVRALGQIRGKGKVSAEELQQISEQLPGFSAINAIAADLGVTTAEAFKLMADGAIPAGEGIEAILAGMEDFPGASGAMERQSKTLNGVISTFKDTLSTTAIDFITPYLPAISRGVVAFGGFIQNVAVPALDNFIRFISDTVAPGIEGFVELFQEEGLGGVFGRLGDLIAENAPILGQKLLDLGGQLVSWVAPQIPPLLEAFAGLMGDVAAWMLDPGLGLLGDAMAVLIPAVIGWVTEDAIPGLIEALPDMAAAFAEWVATDGVPAFIQGGKDLGAGVVEGFYDALVEGFTPQKTTAELVIPGTGIEIPIPSFASGGVMPGRRGVHSLAFVAGGETILPTHETPLSAFFPQSTGGGGGGVTLAVTQLPGEDQISAGIRALKWHQQVQLAVASR